MISCPQCEERRSLSANAAQWPILGAWAKQKQWPINGVLCWLTDEDWKDLLTAAYEKDSQVRVSPAYGDGGGMVMLGRRTSRYGKKKFTEWLDWLNAESHHAGIRVPAPKNMANQGECVG